MTSKDLRHHAPGEGDSLRRELERWDPVTRTPEGETETTLGRIRHAVRDAAIARDARAPRRWLLAAAASALLLFGSLWALSWSTSRSPNSDSGELARVPGATAPTQQRLTLVASNGVRVYWSIPAADPRALRKEVDHPGDNRERERQ